MADAPQIQKQSTAKNKRKNKSPLASDKTTQPADKRIKSLSQPAMPDTAAKLDALLSKIDSLADRSAATDIKLDDLLAKHASTDTNIDSLASDIAAISTKTSNLEIAQNQLQKDCNQLREDVGRLNQEMRQVQQAALSHSFIVHGLPQDIRNDKPIDILTTIAHKLGITIRENDLKFIALRLNNARRTAYLTGIFHDGKLRQQLLQAGKEQKPLIVDRFFPDLPANSTMRGKEFSVKNQLAQATRTFLAEAHRINNKRFKYLWESNGRIMIRRDDGERSIEIRSHEQLVDILANYEQHAHSQGHRQDRHASHQQR